MVWYYLERSEGCTNLTNVDFIEIRALMPLTVSVIHTNSSNLFYFTAFSFIASQSAITASAITAQIDVIPSCCISVIRFFWVSCSPMTSQQGVKYPMLLTSLKTTICILNEQSRYVWRPPLCPGGQVLHTVGLSSRSLPSSLFLSECSPPFVQSRILPRFPLWFFRRVKYALCC